MQWDLAELTESQLAKLSSISSKILLFTNPLISDQNLTEDLDFAFFFRKVLKIPKYSNAQVITKFLSQECNLDLEGHTDYVTSLAFTKNNARIVSSSSDATIRVWNTQEGRQEGILVGHSDSVNTILVTPDDNFLISGSEDKLIIIWKLKDKSRQYTLQGHTGSVTNLAIASDQKFLESNSSDGTVRIWNLNLRKQVQILHVNTNAVSITGDGKQIIVSPLYYYSIEIWDINPLKKIRVLSGHRNTVICICLSRNSQYIVSGSADMSILVWDRQYFTHRSNIKNISFPFFKNHAFSYQMWFNGHSGSVTCLSIANDDKLLVSGSDDCTIRVWDMISQQEIQQFQGHSGPLSAIAISNDNQCIVSGSFDKRMKFWSLMTNNQQWFARHNSHVMFADITPDNSYIVSSANDKTIIVWSVTQQKQIVVIRFTDRINTLAITDNHRLVLVESLLKVYIFKVM